MRLFKLLFGLGLVCLFLVMVISRIPAGWGAHFALKAAPNLKLAGVTGTLWHGQAGNAQVYFKGKIINLGHLSWQLKPLALLQLKACALVRSDLANADVCRNAAGVNVLSNVFVDRLPAKMLNEMVSTQLAGVGNVTIPEVRVKDSGEVLKINGNVNWVDAGINIGTGWFQLGNYDIALTENGGGGLFADITDVQGNFDVQVRADIAIGQIPKLNGTIHLKPAAPDQIRQFLSAFTEQMDDGGFRVNF